MCPRQPGSESPGVSVKSMRCNGPAPEGRDNARVTALKEVVGEIRPSIVKIPHRAGGDSSRSGTLTNPRVPREGGSTPKAADRHRGAQDRKN